MYVAKQPWSQLSSQSLWNKKMKTYAALATFPEAPQKEAIQEPQFFVNDFLVEAEQQLIQILEALKERHSARIERALFLKNYTNNMFRAYRIKNKQWKTTAKSSVLHELIDIEHEKTALEKFLEAHEAEKQTILELKKEEREALKKELEQKKRELMHKLGIPLPPIIAENIIPLPHNLNSENKISPTNNINSENKISLSNNSNSEKPVATPTPQKFNGTSYNADESEVNNPSNEYGKITPLLGNEKISEIVCDEINTPVHVIYDGKENISTNIQFKSYDELDSLIQLLAKKTQQSVTKESPFLMAETAKFAIQASISTENSKPRLVIEKK